MRLADELIAARNVKEKSNSQSRTRRKEDQP